MSLQVLDRFDLMRLFLCVAETGLISEAARAFGISQPTASRSLKRLETMLGAQLIERSPQGVSLTQAGRDFLDPARRLIDGWHEAADLVKAERTSLSGPIRIAVPVAVGQGFLVAIAARFKRAHPGIAIEWLLSDDAVDVTGGGYDLWLRVGEVQREDLIVRNIYRVERAIVSAAQWPGAEHPRDLEARPSVRLATYVPASIELSDPEGSTYQLRQQATFTTNNLYAAREAVLEGMGYAVLPLWCVREAMSQGLLKRLCDSWRAPSITFSIAYAPGRSRSVRVAALLAFIRSELEDDDGLGIAFIRETGAHDSIVRMTRQPRKPDPACE